MVAASHPQPQDQLVDDDPADTDGGEPHHRGDALPPRTGPGRLPRAASGSIRPGFSGQLDDGFARAIDDFWKVAGPGWSWVLLVPHMLIQQRMPPMQCNVFGPVFARSSSTWSARLPTGW